YRYWTIAGPRAGVVLNRARQADVADRYEPAPPPRRPQTQRHLSLGPGFSVADDDTGEVHQLGDVARRIPWRDSVVAPPPSMPPHRYVIKHRCPLDLWELLAFGIRHQPQSYLAFFRGYKSPLRYLEFGGRRYWESWINKLAFLNTCALDSCEPP